MDFEVLLKKNVFIYVKLLRKVTFKACLFYIFLNVLKKVLCLFLQDIVKLNVTQILIG